MKVTIRSKETNEIVKEVSVSSRREGERVANGMSINLNHDDYYIDESEIENEE